MRHLLGVVGAWMVWAVVLTAGHAADEPAKVCGDTGSPRRPGRWTSEEAWQWYRQQPWLCGVNFLPSTAGNTTEFWQAETFDPATIDGELGWAEKTGLNSCRVFLQYLVWKHDPEGLKQRLDRFLGIAHKHGISTVPVLFDDCAFGDPPLTEPCLGKQREPIPGMIAPSWTPSPGLKAVADKGAWPDLERYVKDIVGRFRDDRRVVFWDLYNEPGNSGMGNRSLPLVEATFAWARQARPCQPLTMSVWNGGLHELNRVMIEQSDVVSFHAYTSYEGMRGAIAQHKSHRRPVICTEWMARLQGSRFQTDLPLLKREAVGCYSWGLVNGRGQFQFPWWSKRGSPEPKVWFHDLFHKDGRPYDPAEIEAIRKATALPTASITGSIRFQGQPVVGEITLQPQGSGEPTTLAVDASGQFRGTMAPGRYSVGIRGNRVPAKYHAPGTSGLWVEIKEGRNDFVFKLMR